MVSVLGELELRWIERLTRPELLNAVWALRDSVPSDLVAGLEEVATEQLQLLLLAARLIHVLRRLRGPK
jgi:hypothetical protein